MKRGFSLLELMICIAILTTGIIFVVEIFSTMLNTSTKGADWSVATALASAQLDRLLYDTTQLNAAATASNGTPTLAPPVSYQPGANEPSQVASINNTTYYITYTVSPVTNSVTLAGTARQLYDVDVQVDWFVQNAGANQGAVIPGYGQLSTHLDRLIYVH